MLSDAARAAGFPGTSRQSDPRAAVVFVVLVLKDGLTIFLFTILFYMIFMYSF